MADPQKPTGATSNTPDCFRTFIGQAVKGFFRADGNSYLVFDDGRALVFHHETGAYWTELPDRVEHALYPVRERLKAETAALADVLALSGVE